MHRVVDLEAGAQQQPVNLPLRSLAVQLGIRLGPGRCRSIGRTVLVNGREPAEWARGVAEHAV